MERESGQVWKTRNSGKEEGNVYCGYMDLTDSCSNLHAVINTVSGHRDRLVKVLKDKRIYKDYICQHDLFP